MLDPLGIVLTVVICLALLGILQLMSTWGERR